MDQSRVPSLILIFGNKIKKHSTFAKIVAFFLRKKKVQTVFWIYARVLMFSSLGCTNELLTLMQVSNSAVMTTIFVKVPIFNHMIFVKLPIKDNQPVLNLNYEKFVFNK